MYIVYFIIILFQIYYRSTAAVVYNSGNEEVNNYNVSTKSNVNATPFSSKKLFEVSKLRLNKNLNLKANIFDKMLSDEMLSIKQQIFERNTTPAPVQLASKKYVPTPILELQQRWPIDRIQSNKEKKLDFENHMKRIDEIVNTEEGNGLEVSECKINCTNERVLGLRSVSEKLHKIDTSSKSTRLSKQCTCENSVEHSHRQSKKPLGLKEPGPQNECTRSTLAVPPITYPFYITYSPYFVGTVAEYSNVYYHPDAINDLKIPKHHKNRKLKKPASDEIDGSLEDDRDYYYYGYEDNTKSTRRHKDKTKTDSRNEPKNIFNNRETFQVVDKDKFIEEVVEDLKTYYNEAVIKDCYCSSSSFKLGLKIIVLFLLQFLI